MQQGMTTGLRLLGSAGLLVFIANCVPLETPEPDEEAAQEARLDSLRQVRCPRLLSSAAEYYKNRDWTSTVRVYNELVELGCDREDPEEVYQYYAIAYEFMDKYDSSEYVLLKGLQVLPDNVDLRKRLAYAYQKQGKLEQQIMEYDRLTVLAPEDLEIKSQLASLYAGQERYDDQISVLKELLALNPTDEVAQGELARAYELSGRDPLEVYGERFRNNPENISYGLDYADRLLEADRPRDAVDVLKRVLAEDPSSKLTYRKLAQAYDQADRLKEATETYERLFKLDPRDHRVAIQISIVAVENLDFAAAFRWAEKAVSLEANGEVYGQLGQVYFKAFHNCRSADISLDDRIVASLAYRHFSRAEELGYRRYATSREWLQDNEVLFSRAQWFMLDSKEKSRGYMKPQSDCYQWVGEELPKDPAW